MIPKKLKAGDKVRVITPSRSLSMPWLNKQLQAIANKRLKDLGLDLTFGKHIHEMDEFNSSSIKSRVDDIHDAFSDKEVKLVITVIGGFNSNQLLRYLDYELIKSNPKIVCGYSDITALSNTIYAKTGVVTYYGPHYFSFGAKKCVDYTVKYFKKCLFENGPFDVIPSKRWSDDRWANKQDRRTFQDNPGYLVINEGEAEGKLIGGNLCTLNLLQGTEYMPDISKSILFLEDDYESQPHDFDRDLQSLVHQPGFDKVKGIVIGRFQKGSHMTDELLIKIIKTKKELKNIPIIANADFGHTNPLFTFPIGGTAKVTSGNNPSIRIIKH